MLKKQRGDQMEQKKIKEWIWKSIKYVVPIAIVLLFMKVTSMNDVGQFVKYFLFDVIVVNFVGIFSAILGIAAISFVSYQVISGKASDPKRAILLTLPLTAMFLGFGYVMASDALNDFADVGNYLTGNISEEYVTIKEFRFEQTSSGDYYDYTFEDGRTFTEIYKGEGFGNVKEGETYFIRYLPRTKKLLSIEGVY